MTVHKETVEYVPQDLIAPAWNPDRPKWMNIIGDPCIAGFQDERDAVKLISTVKSQWDSHPDFSPRPLGYRIVRHHTVTTDTVIYQEYAELNDHLV